MADATLTTEAARVTGTALARRSWRPSDEADALLRGAPLGWPHIVIGPARDRPVARFIVGASGMVLGASTGLFVGGMLGVILALALLPLLPNIAVGLLVVTTLTCGSAGAVVGRRVLQRETFDELL